MKYFVRADFIDPGALLQPPQLAALLEGAVLPSLDALNKLDAEKKISGGLVAGDRAVAFVVEAKDNNELDKFVQTLPFWGLVHWNVTPLASFGERLNRDREKLQQIKAMK